MSRNFAGPNFTPPPPHPPQKKNALNLHTLWESSKEKTKLSFCWEAIKIKLQLEAIKDSFFLHQSVTNSWLQEGSTPRMTSTIVQKIINGCLAQNVPIVANSWKARSWRLLVTLTINTASIAQNASKYSYWVFCFFSTTNIQRLTYYFLGDVAVI